MNRNHDPAVVAELILELFCAPGVVEASRKQISAFLWRHVSSADISAALNLLHHTNQASMRKIAGSFRKRKELWRALPPRYAPPRPPLG